MSKYRNLYRASWVYTDPEDVRVIDSNEVLNEKMMVWGSAERDLDGYAAPDDDFDFAALNPAQIEGSYDGANVIKGEGEADEEAQIMDAAAVVVDAEQRAKELIDEAEERLAHARSECEQMLKDAAEDIENRRLAAAEEGQRSGYNSGMEQATREIEAMKAAIQTERSELHSEYEQLVDELEPRFVALITDIYEKVFDTLLTNYTPIVAHLLTQTMRFADEAKEFIIRVSENDYEYLAAHRDEIRAESAAGSAKIEIIKDRTLAAGACLIETAGGVFDCGFDTQLAGLNKQLRLLSYEG